MDLKQIHENAEEFGVALQSKTSMIEKMRNDIESMNQNMTSKDGDVNLLRQRMADFEAERDAIIRQQSIISEAHSHRINHYVKNMKSVSELWTKKEMHSSTRKRS
eukprot:TRINITY_DN10816_c0_g1_i1.p1 TRINITY_DN10816_c0_g1~~TRINITY_DN10816_c0_g1_i1.p1  ORF type:complete len:105 (+),score=15.28 TRINITY_DN10816_c0_g1_i1:125-439(+)